MKMLIRQTYLFSLIWMAVLVRGQQDLLDSTVIVADPSVPSNLAPGQPPQGFSKEEMEEIIKLFYQQNNKPQLKENSGDVPSALPVYHQQKLIQQQELLPQQLLPSSGMKQSSSGILEAAGMVGAGILGGMIGSQLTDGQQPLYQGGYPYQQGPYYQGGYPAGSAGYNPYPAGYHYQPPVYPSYAAGSGYYPSAGYVPPGNHHHHHNHNNRNPLNAAAQQQPSFTDVDQQQQQQPLGLKKKQQQSPKWPVYPAATPSYYHFIPDQQQYLPRDYFYNQGPAVGPQSMSDMEYTSMMSAIGSLATEGNRDSSPNVPRRPFNLVVNKRFLNQLTGGRGISTNKKTPLIGYLAKPSSQLPMTRDGQIDPQVIEQFAVNDGPFVYLYPEEKK